MKRCAALLLALSLSSSGADAADALRAGERPAPGSTEAELWYGMDQAEKDIQASPYVVHDPELNAYTRRVLCDVVGDYCPDMRLYIIDVPVFNASMAPNGAVLVFTGALLRMQDESELALVLGHEFAHFRQRHSLQGWEKAKRTSAFLATFGVLTWAGGVGLAGGIAQMVGLANVMQFSRENERESDEIGFRLVTAHGYDPQAGVRVWERMLREENADPRRRHDPVFASHPKTSERLEDMRAAAARMPPGDYRRDQARYAAAVRPHLAAWLDAELGKRTFATSIQMIEDLKRDAAPELLATYTFYLAEALRRRNRNDDRDRADVLYAGAVGGVNPPAGAWREYGLVLKRRGRTADAATHLRRYLELEPAAKDRLFIEKDIQSLENRP